MNSHLERKSKRSNANIAANYDDYWPYATLLELAVIQNDEQKARKYLSQCLTVPSEKWQLKTTSDNLLLLGDKDWVKDISEQLIPSL